MQDPVPFGTWLRRYREAHDLTRHDLARLIGCSVETIRKIESGERRPSKQIARLLADLLDIAPEDSAALVEYARTALFRAANRENERNEQLEEIPNNLRRPLTSLLGRQEEVALARSYLLGSSVRLLTLVGPPGVGKTRLSIGVALHVLRSYPDGVYFVPLAQINDAPTVVSAIARVVAGDSGVFPGNAYSAVDLLAQRLRDKHMLLLLDNFEQVPEAASDIAELLQMCPNLRAVVTSRQPLHIRGEQQLEVQPLATPDLRGPLTAVAITASPSVALFVERAQAVRPGFTLSDESAPYVATLCARLDGLPLAIELVAARIKMLAPRALLDHMVGHGQTFEQLDVLAGGAQDLPPRHRTLREAIDWSYALLTAEERTLFSRLSVFSGGCTFVAIEAVCNPKGDLGGGVDATLDLVGSLLDKSLIRMRNVEFGMHNGSQRATADIMGPGVSRFMMLETIREYALEQLVVRGEADRTRQLHVEYFLAMAEAADPQLTGADQKSWLDRLEDDHDNLLSALNWSLERGDIRTAAQFGVALKRFWEVHNHFGEGRRWLDQIIARSAEGAMEPALLAKTLNAAGALAIAQSDHDGAVSSLEKSLELHRGLGDDLGVVSALNNLGMVALSSGRFRDAVPVFEEGLMRLRKMGMSTDDEWGADAGRAAVVLGNLAVAMGHLGDTERAVQLLSESVAVRRKLGNRWGVAAGLGNLAEILRSQGKDEQAIETYKEVIVLLNELGDRVGVAKALMGFAAIALAHGHSQRAAKLIGAADGLIAATGASLSTSDQAEYDRLVSEICSSLDQPELNALGTSGRALSLEEAVGYALEGGS